jgi:hypothetical protein
MIDQIFGTCQTHNNADGRMIHERWYGMDEAVSTYDAEGQLVWAVFLQLSATNLAFSFSRLR